METLTVYRNWQSSYNQTTILKDKFGKVKAVLTGYNQPKKTKNSTVIVRGKKYNLKFE